METLTQKTEENTQQTSTINESKESREIAAKQGEDKDQTNKKLQQIFKQVKTLFALRYTKTDKTPSMIIPHLYLGSIGASLSKDVLVELKIEYVLTAMDEMKHPFPDMIQYKIIRVKDSKEEKISSHFDDSNSFIHNAVSNNKNILVHCFAGISRSSTFVIAYLIKHLSKTFEEALSICKSARPVVCPNPSFVLQLKNFEKEIREPVVEQKLEEVERKEVEELAEQVTKAQISETQIEQQSEKAE